MFRIQFSLILVFSILFQNACIDIILCSTDPQKINSIEMEMPESEKETAESEEKKGEEKVDLKYQIKNSKLCLINEKQLLIQKVRLFHSAHTREVPSPPPKAI